MADRCDAGDVRWITTKLVEALNKQNRQLAIKRIIGARAVANQDELRLLLEEAGFEVAQATLSRDLKEMGVGRVHTAEGLRYVLGPGNEESRLASLISYEIESIESNDVMIVIRTLPGRASGVAEIIDGFRHPDVLGTLAGDNTIFIAPTSTRRLPGLVEDLRRYIIQGRAERQT